jgi:EAL and modified HD-GYP domain-containing signal transduction protein
MVEHSAAADLRTIPGRSQADEMNPLSRLSSLSDPTVYVGRQPIYDPHREIQAYELLYRRSSLDSAARFQDGDRASAEVMLRAFLDIGLPQISAARPVFINFPAALLAADPIIPPDRCVIEVLEDVSADRRNVECLRELKTHGYRIALDDFEYAVEKEAFLKLADYVKLDIRALSPADFVRHTGLLKNSGAVVIAEKVESEEEFRRCGAAGCTLFQGYYLRKPEVLAGKRIPASQLTVLSLIAKIVEADNSISTVADVISRDVTLTYGLLKLANSALYGCRTEIRSASHAVSLLGTDRVFRWATLLILAGQNDCPRGYLEFALQRARMSELISEHYETLPKEAYLAGLLSSLDSICGCPLPDLIGPLPLDSRIKDALLAGAGELGAVLKNVLACESCRIEFPARHKVRLDEMQRAFWEAVLYAESMLAGLKGA